MSEHTHSWCHGPYCHEKKTQDRVRGVKGSKVIRTRRGALVSKQRMKVNGIIFVVTLVYTIISMNTYKLSLE
jgi:hypothetical protein